jgi:C1A family cysteine protease
LLGSRKADPVSKPLKGAGDAKVCDLRQFATSVKDQGSCGSCWTFGTMAAAEGAHFLWSMTDANGNPSSLAEKDAWQLSEQVIMECCGQRYSSNGCGGGGVSGPMQCAVDLGYLVSTTSHPYKASTTNTTCATKAHEAAAIVESWHEPCSNGDEVCVKNLIGGDSGCTTFMTTALKTSIEVIDTFYDYASGVYSDPNCPTDIHNHAVAIVGWGTDEQGMDYWVLRNSWGPAWGDEGYFKMQRGVNMCCVGCENLFFQ